MSTFDGRIKELEKRIEELREGYVLHMRKYHPISEPYTAMRSTGEFIPNFTRTDIKPQEDVREKIAKVLIEYDYRYGTASLTILLDKILAIVKGE